VFIAASLDDYLAILWRDTDNDGDESKEDLASSHTRLTLFEAGSDSTLSEVDTFDVAGPVDISELELQRTSAGELRVLLAYGPWTDLTNGTLGPTVLQTLRLDTAAEPHALVSVASNELPANARPTVYAVKRPCGEGWLIAYWTNNGTSTEAERIVYFRALTLDGDIDLAGDPLFTLAGYGARGVATAPERCSRESTPLLLLGDSPDGAVSKNYDAFQLSFSHADGSISETAHSSLLTGTSGFSRATYYGGEWYVTIRSFATEPTGVYELDVVDGSSRQVTTPVNHGGLSAKTTVDANMFFLPTQGILPVDDGMLITFSNGRPTESELGPETIAVTHRLSCP
jgi:hypothetical protein